MQHLLQGKPRLWETEGWASEMGVPSPPGRAYGWEEFRGKQSPIAAVLACQQAVRASTDDYLAKLTSEDLDRPVRFFDGSERPLREILVLLVAHTASHAGEIAALKGVQGGQGLPF